jgi:ABC-type antimicrobial peptide transport system permease subunit
VAVINQTMAAQAWPGQDPIGKRLRTFRGDVAGEWVTVVGVVVDLMPSSQRANPDPMIYEPYRQSASPSRFTAVLARTKVPPASLGRAFRGEVRTIDRDLPVIGVNTLEDLLALGRWPLRVFGSMFAIFAGIALLLATVGLYAVVAYGVSRRTQEIGVRVALGASTRSILRMVFGAGMRQAGIGLVLGLAAAFGVTRVLTALLVGISPTDPLTFGIVVAVLLGAATLGCAIPARRAMRVDPAIALRHE